MVDRKQKGGFVKGRRGGQTEPNLQILADFRFSCNLQHLGGRFWQKTADFLGKLQETAEFAESRLSHLVCPFQFLPTRGGTAAQENLALQFLMAFCGPQILDIFENPYGAPRPTESQNPQQQKKKFQKSRKPRLSPKVNVRSPKVNVRSPKVNVLSPKVNVKYF